MKRKKDYFYTEEVGTRFGDNDIFGHLNNVIYYSLFDSVINRFLINKCKYDPLSSNTIAISPETRCKFRKSFKYPDTIIAGLSTFKIGKTSVIYDISGDELHDTHVKYPFPEPIIGGACAYDVENSQIYIFLSFFDPHS